MSLDATRRKEQVESVIARVLPTSLKSRCGAVQVARESLGI